MGQELHFMTYNIKYDNPKDTINNWNYRNVVNAWNAGTPIRLIVKSGKNPYAE